MFMLHKRRARKSLVVDTPNIGFYPEGVGGIDGRQPVISIQIGDYTMFAKKVEFDKIVERLNFLAKECAS